MAYVMIHGKGLTGLGGLGRAPGAINARAITTTNSGIFSGEPGQQRGMRDGLGPHFFATVRPGTRGGVFRDFRTQRVGGLGGLGAVSTGITVAQIGIARLALTALAAKAIFVQNTTDDIQRKETARLCHDFASRIGPAKLDSIASNPTAANSVTALASLQGSTKGISDALGFSITDVLTFLAMPIIATGLVTAEDIDEARESAKTVVDISLQALDEIPNPFRPSTLPWWIGPAAITAVVAYIVVNRRRS